MSRAVLISLVIFFLTIGLAIAAPIHGPVQSLAERSVNYDDALAVRHLDSLLNRELATEGEITAREYLATVILEGLRPVPHSAKRSQLELKNHWLQDILHKKHGHKK
ncbi:hypothetical protein GALMADRAFT_216766 [Galerina marginata CBS 339.88]|uniref:Uncharacterized protein n=1 Tax=Galerina marginata (strain CBS 339.88) TaxID=685588 RepID=A0A067SAD7_GALM3|nr:hypothetical protein GALMADRAFT_216766 [Galerina marginata CBS 339.88]